MATWQQLCCPELLERVASFLPRNEVVFTLRVLDKLTATALSGLEQHKTVKASEPLPALAYAGLQRVTFARLATATSREQRRQVVRFAARTGSMAAVAGALKAMDLQLGDWVFAAAAAAPDDKAAVRLLRQLADAAAGKACLPLPGDVLLAAAEAGNLRACKWMMQTNTRVHWRMGAVFAAARAGHAHVARWLVERGTGQHLQHLFVCDLLKAAAHGCSLQEVSRFYDDFWGQLGEGAGSEAAGDTAFGPGRARRSRVGGLTCHFHASGFEDALVAAAGSPQPDWLARLDTLLSLHCGGDDRGQEVLAGCGGTLSRVFGAAMSAPDGQERVRLLWEQRGWRPADGLQSAMVAAAARGDLGAFRFLFDDLGARLPQREPNRSVVSHDIVWNAGRAGQLHVLQALRRDHGLGISDEHCFKGLLRVAGDSENLDMARWLVDEAAADLAVAQLQQEWQQAGRAWGQPPPPPQQPQQRQQDKDLRVALLRSIAAAELKTAGCIKGLLAVVRYAFGLAPGRPSQPRPIGMLQFAVRAASPPLLRLLQEHTRVITRVLPESNLYSEAAGDRPTLRMLVQLRCHTYDSHLALLALLEDPTVPLSELRWLLERDAEGGGGGAQKRHGGGTSGSGWATDSSKAARASNTPASMGPAAAPLLRADLSPLLGVH